MICSYLDNRVHAVLYFIEPNGHALKEADVEFMRCIARRANVIPVVSKADSMTKAELTAFKQQVGLMNIFDCSSL